MKRYIQREYIEFGWETLPAREEFLRNVEFRLFTTEIAINASLVAKWMMNGDN